MWYHVYNIGDVSKHSFVLCVGGTSDCGRILDLSRRNEWCRTEVHVCGVEVCSQRSQSHGVRSLLTIDVEEIEDSHACTSRRSLI